MCVCVSKLLCAAFIAITFITFPFRTISFVPFYLRRNGFCYQLPLLFISFVFLTRARVYSIHIREKDEENEKKSQVFFLLLGFVISVVLVLFSRFANTLL